MAWLGEMWVAVLRKLVVLTQWVHAVRMKLLLKWTNIPTHKSTHRSQHHLTLDTGVSSLTDPRVIARSLRRAPERRRRRKSNQFRSAMSMLNFYLDRIGRKLAKAQDGRLETAKTKLRRLYYRKFGG